MFGENRRVERSPAYRYRLNEGGMMNAEGLEEEDSDNLTCIDVPQVKVQFNNTEVGTGSQVATLIVVDQATIMATDTYKRERSSQDGTVSSSNWVVKFSLEGTNLTVSWLDETKKIGVGVYSESHAAINTYSDSQSSEKMLLVSRLLKELSIQNMVILGGISKTDMIVTSGSIVSHSIFSLHSSTGPNPNFKGNAYPLLPSPNLMQGFAAAVFTQCEYFQIPTTVLITNYQLGSELRRQSQKLLHLIIKDLVSPDHTNLTWLLGKSIPSLSTPSSQPFGLIFT